MLTNADLLTGLAGACATTDRVDPTTVSTPIAAPLPATAPEAVQSASAAPATAAPATAKLQPPRAHQRGEVTNVWGVPFDRVTMDEAVDAISDMIAQGLPRYVITANLNYAMLAASDARLAAITADASLILADGQPIVWRSMLGGAQAALPCRVTGSELIYRLANKASKVGWRIYFLGAEPGVAQACADKLAECYPGLEVAGVQSPPYRMLSDDEKRRQLDQIRAARPDILLVAFGQPKGEKWIHENYQSLGVPVSIQIGASFDFVAGRAKRAPLLWQRLGLEWAHRTLSDPRRLAPRYYRNARFLATSLICDWAAYVHQRCGTTPSPIATDRRAELS
jgi:N-acetylglucosaminyldiphosphoundecaprenol N-acetyl-beta-D-mannosaminyltransferase